MQLSESVLPQLPTAIAQPDYDRRKLQPRLVHLGFGAFHRAHQAMYADRLARSGQSDWGYCEINLIGGESQTAAIRQQDYLYTVSEMDDAQWHTRVIGVICEALHAAQDGIDAVLDVLTRPEVAIVSLTVTEKGYCYLPASASLDLQHPLIQHDLATPSAPKSVPGVLVEALARRRQRQIAPFTILSCDNMPANGQITQNVVLALAQHRDPALATWIRQRVTFPSTMVDRIVPAMTEENLLRLQQKLGGIKDAAGVVSEPFCQWVIEDRFVAGRPQWETVGAELVKDVLPYEEMKLRMLNGSHSFLAYLGYLAGYQTIDACMQDEDYRFAARQLMLREQAPTLTVQGVDLAAYADSLLARFSNTGLKHRTWQIAMDGTLKLPQRMLDSVSYHLAHHTAWPCLALGIAGWMRYVSGVDDQGQPIEVSDPQAALLRDKVANSTDGVERVRTLLDLPHVFTPALTGNADFVNQVTTAYLTLKAQGARQAVADLARQLQPA